MIPQLSVQELHQWLSEGKPVRLLDVRFAEEKAAADLGGELIPLPELEQRWREISSDPGPLVVYCHHGVRSMHACGFLRAVGVEAINLRGGIDAWSQLVDPNVPRY